LETLTTGCSLDDLGCLLRVSESCCSYYKEDEYSGSIGRTGNIILRRALEAGKTPPVVLPGPGSTTVTSSPEIGDGSLSSSEKNQLSRSRTGRLVLWVPADTAVTLSMPSDPDSCGTPVWRHNNVLMKGERSQHLSLWTGVGAADGGEYTCICGDTVWSAVVAMLAPPRVRETFRQIFVLLGNGLRLEVDTLPAVVYNITNDAGSSATASVRSADPLRYVWFRNGIEVPGEHERVLSIPRVRAGHSGTYHCQVSNAHGSARWGEVVVIVTTDASKIEAHEQKTAVIQRWKNNPEGNTMGQP
jgi:hypothetical protein